ncbi:MAG: sterol desaturase family protein [Actinomycetota bacterium]
MRERPTLTRFIVTDLLWWAGWFLLSFVVGWDITDQLVSPLFWVIAAALVMWRVLEWRSYDRPTPDGGHHDPELAERPDDRGHSETIRRSLIGFVALAFVGLVVANLTADPDVGEGRTLLLGEESLESSGYADWSSTTAAAIDAEILGLTLYDYSLLVGLVIVAIEVVALFVRRGSDRSLWFRDTFASLSTQIPFYVIEVFTVLAMIGAYFVIWDNVTPYQLPINGWTIAAGVLAADFAYYWEHRTAHEVRVLWTGHAVHHSSPIFNTAVAFRFGPFEPVLAILFHLPLVLLGFHPAIVILGELAVQAYQFWIHTEVIGGLGPLDRVLNTPSNHRVHHGSDSKYLDRNHGGILMIWDHAFGTYQAEEETPTYGLTTQIETTNPIKVWFSEFPALFRDLRGARSWREWFGFLLNRPGWRPTA